MDIQEQIANALDIPLYLVILTTDFKYFLVYDYKNKKYEEMDELRYIRFIINLGKMK